MEANERFAESGAVIHTVLRQEVRSCMSAAQRLDVLDLYSGVYHPLLHPTTYSILRVPSILGRLPRNFPVRACSARDCIIAAARGRPLWEVSFSLMMMIVTPQKETSSRHSDQAQWRMLYADISSSD